MECAICAGISIPNLGWYDKTLKSTLPRADRFHRRNESGNGFPKGKGNPMNQDIARKVTESILSALEKGTVPWRKPWELRSDISFATRKPYRGMNPLILSSVRGEKGYCSPYWITFQQARKAGGTVKAGEHGTAVVFWKFLELEEKETGKKKHVPLLRYYTVFSLDQTEGVPVPKTAENPNPVHPIARMEEVVSSMPLCPPVQHGGDRACYAPRLDRVSMPPMESFTGSLEYYATLLHELAHSTGHPSRLARFNLEEPMPPFGSGDYGFEELIAEMGSAYVLAECGMEEQEQILPNTAAYVDHWRKVVQDDPQAFLKACGKAQKAADWILGTQVQTQTQTEDVA